ncbi:unnamed protein product [Penicillium salamii]|uniref:Major facilitator superfamily (MFS) profile domain-containing protein n=1 Tax=Penicillium salamii TaxID=1612424 RepID=A0A9W4NKB8_9EURO|nr:unnamed protein product [Penicillium salamii]CAG8369351.1 unnamed protein product [Penicillium salamii]CAG8372871.1 unnamed protein product [Penicillium salamii]CAG8377743.1 unnamed protein product [Penicillium salamii]
MDVDKEPIDSLHVEATTADMITAKKLDHEVLEHEMTLRHALTSYRKAMLYCLFFCFSAILWGYDMQVNGGFLAAPEFRAVFGYTQPDGTTILPARWQAAFNMIATVGGMGGSLVCGPLSPYVGRKITLAMACVVSSGSIFLQFFAFSRGVLLAGKLLNGISLGMFLVTACSYCSEACPVVLRGITIAMVNLFVVIGQLLGNCLIRAFGGRSDTFAYRIPFAFQWLFPAILIVGVWFCPESPYWYVQRGKHAEAKKSLERFQTGGGVESWLVEIQETVRMEEESAQSAGYLDCFRGTDLRRTLIVIAVWTINSFSGVNFVLSYSTYFFQIAGLPTSRSFDMGVGVTAVGVVGNICSWWVINTIGRRSLFPGMVVLTIIVFIIGILDVVPNYNSSIAWGQSALIIIWNFFYDLTLGPLGYVICGEMSSTRLRSYGVSIGFFTQNFWTLIMTITVPYMINPDEGDLRGKTGFIFGGFSIIACIWTYFCLPETKGRTFEELDHMFEQKIPARDFAKHDRRAHGA